MDWAIILLFLASFVAFLFIRMIARNRSPILNACMIEISDYIELSDRKNSFDNIANVKKILKKYNVDEKLAVHLATMLDIELNNRGIYNKEVELLIRSTYRD